MEKIDLEFLKKFNSNKFLPDKGYRRTSLFYPLIANTNCIIGAVLSDNDELIQLLVEREKFYLEDLKKIIDHTYLSLCDELLEIIDKLY